jgi:hypothetical protein
MVVALGVLVLVGFFLWISLPQQACYGLPDRDVVRNIIRDYSSEPPSARSGPADVDMKLGFERVAGIGRNRAAKGEGLYVTQVWFRQDDGTMIVASYYEDGDLKFSPSATREEMAHAVYAPHAPDF